MYAQSCLFLWRWYLLVHSNCINDPTHTTTNGVTNNSAAHGQISMSNPPSPFPPLSPLPLPLIPILRFPFPFLPFLPSLFSTLRRSTNPHNSGRSILHCCWSTSVEQSTTSSPWLWTIVFRVSPVTENALVWLKIVAPSDLLLHVVRLTNVLTYLLFFPYPPYFNIYYEAHLFGLRWGQCWCGGSWCCI